MFNVIYFRVSLYFIFHYGEFDSRLLQSLRLCNRVRQELITGGEAPGGEAPVWSDPQLLYLKALRSELHPSPESPLTHLIPSPLSSRCLVRLPTLCPFSLLLMSPPWSCLCHCAPGPLRARLVPASCSSLGTLPGSLFRLSFPACSLALRGPSSVQR